MSDDTPPVPPVSAALPLPALPRVRTPRPQVVGWLIEESGENSGRDHPVRVGENTIGEYPHPISIKSEFTSQHHATLNAYWADDALEWSYVLDDAGSTNGTEVDGQRVYRRELRDGDDILFADVSCTFRSLEPPLRLDDLDVDEPALLAALLRDGPTRAAIRAWIEDEQLRASFPPAE